MKTTRSAPLLIAAFCFLMTSTAMARWAVEAEQAAGLNFERYEIQVQKEGRYKVTREMEILIQNDQGREAESLQNLPFNSRASSLKILSAYTKNGEKKFFVDSKNIEFRETGESKVFDRIKQATITFPHVQIGSKLYLKYEIQFNEVPFPSSWSYSIAPDREWMKEFSLKISSPTKLFTFVHDPRGDYELVENKNKSRYEVILKNKKPILRSVIEEESPSFMAENVATFGFSTLKNWSEFGRDVQANYERGLQAPLPESVRSWIPILKEIKDPVVKLNTLHAKMAEEFRYFGDWRRIRGGHVPRSLSEIAATHYGDCKDLSQMMTALLRALGLKANVAWVYRGEVPLLNKVYALPMENLFNHAITRAEVDGKVYWLDPTNPVAFAQGVPLDIAGRPAYVVGAFAMDEIPPLTSDLRSQDVTLNYELLANDHVAVSGDWKIKGLDAIQLTAKMFFAPPKVVHYDIVRYLAIGQKVLSYSVGELQRSRIVQDLTVPVQLKMSEFGLRTSAGLGFPLLRDSVIERLLGDPAQRVSDLYLQPPGTKRSRSAIKNARQVGQVSLSCDIDSPWIRIKRQVTDGKGGVTVDDFYEVKRPFISNGEIRTTQFSEFQDQVMVCFYRAAVILKKN